MNNRRTKFACTRLAVVGSLLLMLLGGAAVGVASAMDCTNNGVIVANSYGKACDSCENNGIVVVVESTCNASGRGPNACVDDACYLVNDYRAL